MILTMPGNLQPLDQKFPIVTPDGRPTLYFIQWAQQKQIDIGAGITAEQALVIIEQYFADHQLQAGTGISISPSGNLSDSPTVAAEVQAILDQISTTHGTILFRGATNWEVLAPGAAGLFLRTNGAGADPSWASAGGGGGSFAYLSFVPGAPPTINASSNIASVTRTNTGRYKVTFSSPAANNRYTVVGSGRFGDSTISDNIPVLGIDRRTGFGQFTTYFDAVLYNPEGTISDNVTFFNLLVFA